jgi:hypothetical protein
MLDMAQHIRAGNAIQEWAQVALDIILVAGAAGKHAQQHRKRHCKELSHTLEYINFS